jgi:hypothetical protein
LASHGSRFPRERYRVRPSRARSMAAPRCQRAWQVIRRCATTRIGARRCWRIAERVEQLDHVELDEWFSVPSRSRPSSSSSGKPSAFEAEWNVPDSLISRVASRNASKLRRARAERAGRFALRVTAPTARRWLRKRSGVWTGPMGGRGTRAPKRRSRDWARSPLFATLERSDRRDPDAQGGKFPSPRWQAGERRLSVALGVGGRPWPSVDTFHLNAQILDGEDRAGAEDGDSGRR